MAEKAATDIPVDSYRSDLDFEEWIELFETAVEVATKPPDEPRKLALYKKWLPIKLDDQTRMIFSSCDKTQAWKDLKEELKKLLVTPEEKYNWRSGRVQIKWDGRENFHVLATRVKRAVDKYEE